MANFQKGIEVQTRAKKDGKHRRGKIQKAVGGGEWQVEFDDGKIETKTTGQLMYVTKDTKAKSSKIAKVTQVLKNVISPKSKRGQSSSSSS